MQHDARPHTVQNMNIWLSLHKTDANTHTHTHTHIFIHSQAPSMHQLSCCCANWLDVVLKIVSVQSPVCLQKRSCPFNSESQQAINRKWLRIKGGGLKVHFTSSYTHCPSTQHGFTVISSAQRIWFLRFNAKTLWGDNRDSIITIIIIILRAQQYSCSILLHTEIGKVGATAASVSVSLFPQRRNVSVSWCFIIFNTADIWLTNQTDTPQTELKLKLNIS